LSSPPSLASCSDSWSALVKARPIEPGEYSATSLDEIEALVAMALITNHAARGVRGLR
jgi:hypothetical protein